MLVGWLVIRLVCGSVGWIVRLVGSSVGRFDVWLIDRLIGSSVGQFIGWMVCWSFGWLNNFMAFVLELVGWFFTFVVWKLVG